MKKRKVIKPEDIEIGMTIRDKSGNEGIVVENMHPWGFKRFQYGIFTVIRHPDPDWYELIKK